MKTVVSAAADREPRPPRAATGFARAAYAAMTAAARIGRFADMDTAEVAAQMFPDDRLARRLLQAPRQRSAVEPADSGRWDASVPVPLVALDFIRGLGPESAAARLISRATNFTVDTAGGVLLPRRATGPAEFSWVGEGDPVPMLADALDGVTLPAPKKIAAGMTFTREFFRRQFAQEVVDAVLRESAARSLDAAYFSDQDATSDSLAGLLFDAVDASSGISPEPRQCLATLARRVATGSNGSVTFVTGAGRAAEIGILVPEMRSDVFGSGAVSDDTIIAVDHSSFAHGVGDVEIDASREAVVHRETEPEQIVTSGTPASPVTSAWQHDMIAAQVVVDLTYVARRSGAVAYVSGISW